MTKFHRQFIFYTLLAKMTKSIAGGKYQLTTAIAAGSFGKVYEDPPYAIKEVRLPTQLSHYRAITSIINNEIRILTQFNHDNIVKLFEIVEEGSYVYIVMELCDGDLRRFTENGPIGENLACKYLRQIMNGYGELVRMGIVHRDLKPANILFKNSCLKLADFGMSKLQEGNQLLRSHVGTPYYMAPQVLQRIDYTRKCDIWSIGVIFYEMLCGQLPWMGKNQEGLLNAIMTQPLRIPSILSEGVRQILQGMLAISEGRRLSFSQVQMLLTLQEKMQSKYWQRSFHWSLVREMVQNQADHEARRRFNHSYNQLSIEQKVEIKGALCNLFRQQDAYILNFLQD